MRKQGVFSLPRINKAQHIRDLIAQGKTPADAITETVQQFGALPPRQAQLIAQETGIPIPGTDNRVHDGRPLEVIERDSARIQRQQGLIESLRHIVTKMGPTEVEVKDWPSYSRESLESVLKPALEWLTSFEQDWQRHS